MTEEELKAYPRDKIKVMYDRAEDKWITFADLYFIKNMRIFEG